MLLDRRTRSAHGGSNFFSLYYLSLFLFLCSVLYRNHRHVTYGGLQDGWWKNCSYSAVSRQQLSYFLKKVFAVISWPWGLRIHMADNIRGEKRVGTGPDRKGECIVYSTPPSSRLPISVTAIGFPDN